MTNRRFATFCTGLFVLLIGCDSNGSNSGPGENRENGSVNNSDVNRAKNPGTERDSNNRIGNQPGGMQIEPSLPAKNANIVNGKIYGSAKELFADMPKDAYPKLGAEFGLERAAAKKWMENHLVGEMRMVEWKGMVEGIAISGDSPFTVRLLMRTKALYFSGGGPYHGMPFDAPISLGGQMCQATISAVRIVSHINLYQNGCTADEAKALRALKGKTVTFRGAIAWTDQRTSFDQQDANNLFEPVKNTIALIIRFPVLAVNGKVPAAARFARADRAFKTLDGRLVAKLEYGRVDNRNGFACSITYPGKNGKAMRLVTDARFPNFQTGFAFVESSSRVWLYDGKLLYRYDIRDGVVTRTSTATNPALAQAAPEAVRAKLK